MAEKPLKTCFECKALYRPNALYDEPHPYVRGENCCRECHISLNIKYSEPHAREERYRQDDLD